MARFIGGQWRWPELVILDGEADQLPDRPQPPVVVIEDDDDHDEGINNNAIQFLNSRSPSLALPDVGVDAKSARLGQPTANQPDPLTMDQMSATFSMNDLINDEPSASSVDVPNIGSVSSNPREPFIIDFVSCLQSVLVLFPEVDPEHVRGMYEGLEIFDGVHKLPIPAVTRFDSIVDKLLADANYPKQEKASKKRKIHPTEEEVQTKRWAAPGREVAPQALRSTISNILKKDFPLIPTTFINEQLTANKHLYQTYLGLAEAQDNNQSNRLFGKGRPSQIRESADELAAKASWPAIVDELRDARNAVRNARAKKEAEQNNLQRAIALGETAECQACFDTLPMNRQIFCNGEDPHFTCFDCALTYIKSEVGQARSNVVCTAGCGAGFLHSQLQKLPDKRLLEKLGQIQQEKDIRDAEIEDLEECPFCDFKAIVPSLQDDFEFRCANPECERVSCRRCKGVSHIPMSCEDARGDRKLGKRHLIEEAMSTALIRTCNKCKTPFIKQDGCNKIRCSNCSHLQCYICSQSIKDYRHFEDGHPGRNSGTGCYIHDNSQKRHEKEVEDAENAARARVLEENPDISEQDLKIQVSDAVNQDSVRRAGAGPARHAHQHRHHRHIDFGVMPRHLPHLHGDPDQFGHARLAPMPMPQFDLRREPRLPAIRPHHERFHANLEPQMNDAVFQPQLPPPLPLPQLHQQLDLPARPLPMPVLPNLAVVPDAAFQFNYNHFLLPQHQHQERQQDQQQEQLQRRRLQQQLMLRQAMLRQQQQQAQRHQLDWQRQRAMADDLENGIGDHDQNANFFGNR